jgi:hypothetical protein
MTTTLERIGILQKIRDHYSDIQMITMHCCSDISPEAIPDMIRQRNELINLIASEQRLLVAEENDDGFSPDEVKSLEGEIQEIIKSIMSLDRQVEEVIREHMYRIQSDLATLHKTSRAASAYTFQTRT